MYFDRLACYGSAMSGRCARPECQELAAFWYLALPGAQVVEVFGQPQSHGVALCETHFLRFSLPAGWQLTRFDLGSTQQPPLPDLVSTSRDDVQDFGPPPQAEVTRARQPWFLDDSTEAIADIDEGEPSLSTGGTGLLDRAFNGPRVRSHQRDEVVAPSSSFLARPSQEMASNAPVLERGSQFVGYEMDELPFPPATSRPAKSG